MRIAMRANLQSLPKNILIYLLLSTLSRRRLVIGDVQSYSNSIFAASNFFMHYTIQTGRKTMLPQNIEAKPHKTDADICPELREKIKNRIFRLIS
jgi:hypothetical protein